MKQSRDFMGKISSIIIISSRILDALSLIRHYGFSLKDMGWKHTAYRINNSDPCAWSSDNFCQSF